MDRSLGFPEKLLLVLAGALSLATGLLLYLLPGRTQDYFAWTIQNPLTAVFMGASYLAGTGTFAALRAGTWPAMRPQMPFMLVFGTMQLLATLLHLATFTFEHALAWAWLAVYAISVPLAWFVFAHNERAMAGGRYARAPARLPPLALLLLALATVHIAVGLALFVAPDLMKRVWPWSLTPLTARILAGWYTAGGVSVWARMLQPSSEKGQTGQIAGFVVVPLLLLGALRYPGAFTGPAAATALYLVDVVLAGALLVAARLSAARRTRQGAPL
jgi:hypothetical protein